MSVALILEAFDTSPLADRHGNGIEPDAPDPEIVAMIENLETEQNQVAMQIQTLNALIAEISQYRSTMEQEFRQQATACLMESMAQLLPSMAREGFHNEIATACCQLIQSKDIENAHLAVCPSDQAKIQAALEKHGATLDIRLADDTQLSPGQMELRWPDGGAHFDTEATVKTALDIFTKRLTQFQSEDDSE